MRRYTYVRVETVHLDNTDRDKMRCTWTYTLQVYIHSYLLPEKHRKREIEEEQKKKRRRRRRMTWSAGAYKIFCLLAYRRIQENRLDPAQTEKRRKISSPPLPYREREREEEQRSSSAYRKKLKRTERVEPPARPE